MDIKPARKEKIARIVACFNAVLSKDLDMDSFEDRIRLQKLIYIIQQAGIGLDYSFGWHIRGPYSPGLADDGYAYNENKGKTDFSYAFSDSEMRVIGRIKDISEYLKNGGNSELLASLLYLSQLLGISGEKLREELKTRKPHFSDKDMDLALEKWGRVSTK